MIGGGKSSKYPEKRRFHNEYEKVRKKEDHRWLPKRPKRKVRRKNRLIY